MSSTEAVERLFIAHRSLVFGYLLRRSRDRELAADLAQEVFLRAARNLGGFSGGSETAWLLTIARNLLIDHWKRRRLPMDDSPFADELVGDENLSESVATRLAVKAAMAKCDARDQRLLTLLYVDGFTAKEVAAMSGLTEGAVRMAALRSREAFRRHFTSDME